MTALTPALRRSEYVFGLIYLPLHVIILPRYLFRALALVGILPEGAYGSLMFFAIAFAAVSLGAYRFLRDSFSEFTKIFLQSLKIIAIAVVFSLLFEKAVSMLLAGAFNLGSNPNQAEALVETRRNAGVMTIAAVLFAPIVEETLFRGVLFGSIRKKSRVAAYVVSVLVFSAYHVWQFAWGAKNPLLLAYLVQYIPASAALAWSYERSGNIWTSILTHAAVNIAAAVSAQVSLFW